jgi:hypothetical protein
MIAEVRQDDQTGTPPLRNGPSRPILFPDHSVPVMATRLILNLAWPATAMLGEAMH